MSALGALRERLRGLSNELKQLIGKDDRRWRRFGLNIPGEPETPDQPRELEASASAPGKVLVSCAAVAFAERYRFYAQKADVAGDPTAIGSSNEPLFVMENLDGGARYNVFVSAVNFAGNEGPRSKAVVTEVMARAA